MTNAELFNACEAILKTLPKAHYLKIDTIPVTLSATASTSYFEPAKWRIVVAFANILAAISGKGEAITEESLEETIRALCYHEISHAMLTPFDFMEYMSTFFRIPCDLANIIEDERIETINAHYFAGVDFKKNIKAICAYHTPTDYLGWVYVALRLRKAPFGLEEALEAFAEFVRKTRKINAFGCKAFELAKHAKNLLEKLAAIYKKHAPEVEEKTEDEKGDGEKRDGGEGADGERPEYDEAEDAEIGDGIGDEGKDKEQIESDSEKTPKREPSEEAEEAEDGEDSDEEDVPVEESDRDLSLPFEDSEEAMKEASLMAKKRGNASGGYILKTSDFTANSEAKTGMLKAIIRNKGVGVSEAPTIAAYNGKFNVKRYVKDQHLTMKWFDKSLDGGESKKAKGEKKRLNLWLDQSGSFDKHDDTINAILKALCEIEESRNDFEWTLIKLTCNVEIVKDKARRVSKSWSGNALPVNAIRKAYAEVNHGSEVNIVLFDGRANSRDFGYGVEAENSAETYSYDALKPFNNRRSIFITEYSNTESIKRVCPEARDVIEENYDYEERLTANVVRAFDLLF